MTSSMTNVLNRSQKKASRPSDEQLAAFGAELDALRERTLSDLGERDARYIRRIVAAVRYTEVIGRGLLFLACSRQRGFSAPCCWAFRKFSTIWSWAITSCMASMTG